VISPLRERWLQQTGDLLADTFVDAKGIQPYRYTISMIGTAELYGIEQRQHRSLLFFNVDRTWVGSMNVQQ
jgi:hypothetical protein